MYDVNLTESFFPAQTDAPIWETTVGQLLRDIAANNPDGSALVEVTIHGEIGRRWGYRELLAECDELAHALASRYQPGERVVVWAPNIPEWVLMEYACALAGLVLVTANPAYQTKELRYVLEHSGASGLFLVESYRGNPMADIAHEAIAGLTDFREIIDLSNREVLFHTASSISELPDVHAGDAAQVQYTSGTTGFPKGAVLSHRGLVNNARFYAERCGVTQTSTWINIMPMFHTSGCGMVTLGCLQAGCEMVLISLFDPAAILALIESEKADIILGVPTMVVALLEAHDQQPRDMSSLQLLSSGGSMVAPELVRRVQAAFGCGFSTLYGQTEHCPVITQHHIGDDLDDICHSTGQPIAQTDVSIRSVDDNQVVAIGSSGEICARSPSTMIGYYADAAATAAAIDDQGWLHTGDLGVMDTRGYVRITGRVKDMIIRGGENHFPVEIENVLLEHPSIAEVAVVGLPDEKWGEIIAGFVRTEGNRPFDTQELHHYCRQHMSPQKTPTIWRQIEAFPLTGSGKIQKFKLREKFLAGDYPEL